MKLYDQKNMDEIVWPETAEAQQAKSIFVPMIKEGVEKYISNVKTKLYLFQIDQHILPVTVNEKEYNNSYLTSNYFPIKHLDEIVHQKHPALYFLQKPLTWGLGLFLKGFKINKAVIVNNWLLTSNIYPKLDQSQIERMTDFIANAFPDHTIFFRNLNSRICSDLASHLSNKRYRVMWSRHVFVYDPEWKKELPSKAKYHHRRDKRLIQTEGYEIVRTDTIKQEELKRLISLYSKIYISRHTKYSPHYTEKFLDQAIKQGFFRIIGLKRDGEIHGAMGCYVKNDVLTVPFFGFDPHHGEPNHLYRMLTILAIEEAEKENMILNDGSGGDAPKSYRGMKSFPEYVALYDRHLPIHRRIFWSAAEKVMNLLAPKK